MGKRGEGVLTLSLSSHYLIPPQKNINLLLNWFDFSISSPPTIPLNLEISPLPSGGLTESAHVLVYRYAPFFFLQCCTQSGKKRPSLFSDRFPTSFFSSPSPLLPLVFLLSLARNGKRPFQVRGRKREIVFVCAPHSALLFCSCKVKQSQKKANKAAEDT